MSRQSNLDNPVCQDDSLVSDPHTFVDDVVVWGGTALLVVTMAMNLYMLYRKDYPPFKAKGVGLTLLSTIGGTVWFYAGLVVNVNIDNTPDTIFSQCLIWTVWLHMPFGFHLFMSCLIYRLYQLHNVFNKHRLPPIGYGPGVAMLNTLPTLYCVALTVMDANLYCGNKEECFYAPRIFVFITSGVFFIYGIGHLVVAFFLRHIRDTFNEYKETAAAGLFVTIFWFVALGLAATDISLTVPGRLIISLMRLITVVAYFQVRCFYPVWQCIFHEKEYLKKFRAQMKRDSDLALEAGMKAGDLSAGTRDSTQPAMEINTGKYVPKPLEEDHGAGAAAPISTGDDGDDAAAPMTGGDDDGE